MTGCIRSSAFEETKDTIEDVIKTPLCIITLAVCLVLVPSAVSAQEQQDNQQQFVQQPTQAIDPQQNSPPSLDSLTPEQILWYLANEKVLAAGIGFVNAQLGDALSAVISIWGEPVALETSILGNVKVSYRPDPDTLVVFEGREAVKNISVKGQFASLLRTQRGARFGMLSADVLALYLGSEARVTRSRIKISSLGVSFYLVDNRVAEIVVYSPDS